MASDVVEFFGQVKTSKDVANEALSYIAENDATEYEAAFNFLQNNEDMWSEWVTDEAKDRVKNAIDDL